MIKLVSVGCALLISALCAGQEPVDLFPDVPAYASGFVRIGAWNVRHLNVEPNSEDFFAGRDREEDLAILTASFAKAIRDLQLDLLVLVEVQPRVGEPDRLRQILLDLNGADGDHWRSDVTHLEYDEPEDPYGNLQFGLLWNTARAVRIDPAKNRVLEELRQPRSPTSGPLRKEQRAPWLIPVTVQTSEAQRLEFDMLALHLKSGGATPQAAEVDAITRFIRGHQMLASRRHLIVCGDWNIRPDEEDQGRGRPRLLKMTIPNGREGLMRILTVGEIGPDLTEWEQLADRIGELSRFPAISKILPYSHIGLRAEAYDSLLDHLAISRTLDELFDHPLEVHLASGRRDLRPGIEIVTPLVPHADYLHFTDHLPIVLTLRVDNVASDRPAPRVQIVAVEPNPIGDESQAERTVLRNLSAGSIDLCGWRIQDSAGNFWRLDRQDSNQANGRLARGRTVTIRRRGRPMTLSNSGDTIALFDSAGNLVETKTFGPTKTGEIVRTE